MNKNKFIFKHNILTFRNMMKLRTDFDVKSFNKPSAFGLLWLSEDKCDWRALYIRNRTSIPFET